MRKALKIFLAIVLILVSVCLALIYWLSNTQSGLRWGLSMAPDSVQFASVEGRLADLSFKGLSITLDGTEVAIGSGKIQWQPFELLNKRIIVDSLSADQIRIALATPAEATDTQFEPWSGVSVPIAVSLKRGEVQNIQLVVGDETQFVDSLIVRDAKVRDDQLRFKQLLVSQAQNRVDAAGKIDLSASPKGTVGLDYTITWVDSDTRVESVGSVEGKWKSLALSQTFTQPLNLKVDAQILDPLSNLIRWDAQFEVSEVTTQAIDQVITLDFGELTSTGNIVPGLGLNGLNVSLSGQLSGGNQRFGFWDVDTDLRINNGDASVEKLLINQKLGEPAAVIDASGIIKNVLAFIGSSKDSGIINLQGTVSDLPWPLTGVPTYLVKDGQFNLKGSDSDYSLNAMAKGTANGQPLDAVADLDIQSGSININQLTLNSGQTVAKVTGAVNDNYDLAWDLQSPNIGDLIADARGSFDSRGSLSGKREKPRLQFDAQAKAISLFSYAVDDLVAEVDVSLASLSEKLSIALSAKNLRNADSTLASNIELLSTGTGAKHQLQLSSKLGESATLSALIKGGLVDDHWRGQLATLSLDDTALDSWSLVEPAEIDISSKVASVSSSCLQNKLQSLCLELKRTQEQLELSAQLQDFQFANADRFTNLYDFKTTGVLNGQLSYLKKADQPSAVIDAQLDSSDAVIEWFAQGSSSPDGSDSQLATAQERETLELQQINLVVRQRQNLSLEAYVNLQNGDRIELEAAVASPIESKQFSQAALSGHAKATIGQLAALPPSLLSDVSLNGQLNADLAIDGTVAEPKFSATADVSNASAKVRELGLDFTDIELNIRSDQQAIMVLEGQLNSGEGQLEISGTVDASNAKQPSIQLALKGEKLQLSNVPELTAIGSIDLTANIHKELMSLDGSIILDQAELDFKLPESAILASDDVVLLGEEEKSRETPQKLDLLIDLGQKTHIKAQGLDTFLLGKVRVYQEPTGIIRGEGQINISKGEYQAYGQKLKINKGRLLFSGGSIDDPSLDLKAQKSVDSVTAGVSVTGRAGAPRLNLYSTPSMPDQDILSVLVFGKRLSELGAQDALTLLRIANSLRGDGGQGTLTKLTQRMQDSLGLTDLDLQLSDKNPSIQAGKQVSSKIYIGYGYGLLDAAQSLIMRYQLNKAWSIKADLGVNSGADLRYQIER